MMPGNTQQMMSMMRGMMVPHAEGRIAFLKSELAITEAQTPFWNSFADALRTAARSMNDMYAQMMPANGATTLPSRLEAREAILSAHLTSLKALKDALDPLYASLAEEQKKLADGLMTGPMGMM